MTHSAKRMYIPRRYLIPVRNTFWRDGYDDSATFRIRKESPQGSGARHQLYLVKHKLYAFQRRERGHIERGSVTQPLWCCERHDAAFAGVSLKREADDSKGGKDGVPQNFRGCHDHGLGAGGQNKRQHG